MFELKNLYASCIEFEMMNLNITIGLDPRKTDLVLKCFRMISDKSVMPEPELALASKNNYLRWFLGDFKNKVSGPYHTIVELCGRFVALYQLLDYYPL